MPSWLPTVVAVSTAVLLMAWWIAGAYRRSPSPQQASAQSTNEGERLARRERALQSIDQARGSHLYWLNALQDPRFAAEELPRFVVAGEPWQHRDWIARYDELERVVRGD